MSRHLELKVKIYVIFLLIYIVKLLYFCHFYPKKLIYFLIIALNKSL